MVAHGILHLLGYDHRGRCRCRTDGKPGEGHPRQPGKEPGDDPRLGRSRWRHWPWRRRSGPVSPRRYAHREPMHSATRPTATRERLESPSCSRTGIRFIRRSTRFIRCCLLTAAVPAAWLVTRRVTGGALVVSLLALVIMIWLVGDYLARGFGRARSRTLAYRLAPLLVTTARWGRAANEFVSEDDPGAEPDSTSPGSNGRRRRSGN